MIEWYFQIQLESVEETCLQWTVQNVKNKREVINDARGHYLGVYVKTTTCKSPQNPSQVTAHWSGFSWAINYSQKTISNNREDKLENIWITATRTPIPSNNYCIITACGQARRGYSDVPDEDKKILVWWYFSQIICRWCVPT